MFAGREMPERHSNGTGTAALPTNGRFLQADPLGYGDGMNMYAYVGNDPVNGTDPSGTTGVDKGWWKCYGNCGSGYANDAANGTWTMSPGLSGVAESDGNGGVTYVTTPVRWTFVPSNARLNVWQPDYIRTPNVENVTVTGHRRESDAPAYDPKVNWCGGTGSASLPNSIAGASINDICYRHDVCYGGSDTPKSTCDSRFTLDIILRVGIAGSGADPILKASTGVLGGAVGGGIVGLFGGNFYVKK